MSIKLVVLKSGEDVIADVKELISGDNVVGYLLQDPQLIVAETIPNLSENEDLQESGSNLKITLSPWMPLSKEEQIPVRPDWVVTIIEPISDIREMYEERMNGKFKVGGLDEQSNSDNED